MGKTEDSKKKTGNIQKVVFGT